MTNVRQMKPDRGYPRNMTAWHLTFTKVDAAFYHTDGKTYFFQGEYFYQFDDTTFHVRHHPSYKLLECTATVHLHKPNDV